jgi:DNA-binding transcriptional LysR family regulator
MADRIALGALELLVATDSHGSISAAARALGITQPTASAKLRSLERRLGLDLMRRTTRGAQLTSTGQAVAAWAAQVVEASDRFEGAAASLAKAPADRVRVAASMTVAEYLAPRWLAAGDGSARVELVVRNSRDVMDLVLAGEAELGFVEGAAVRRGLRSRTIATDRLVAVVAPTHPWAAKREVTPAELVAGGLVVRESGSGTREILERALTRQGERLPAHVPYLGSTAAVKTAVEHSGAVAVLSELAVGADLDRGILTAVPIAGLEMERKLRMVWKDGRGLSAAASRIAAVASSPESHGSQSERSAGQGV